MKKISKILLSLSMAFVMIFSLSACDINEDPNETLDPLDVENYQVPTGVDMESVTDYTLWLLENADYTTPFVASVTEVKDHDNPTQTSLEIIKYNYSNGVEKIARYDTSNNLDSYIEIEEVVSGTYNCVVYNPNTLKYTEHVEDSDGILKSRANEQMAQSVIALMWQMELNSFDGYNIGDIIDYDELFDGSGFTVHEEITNPSKGKYILIREFKYNNVTGQKYITTVVNNKVTNFKLYTTILDDLVLAGEVVYEYKSRSISIDKSLYTKES